MQFLKSTAVASAALLATLGSGVVHAQSNTEVHALKNTVEQLRKQLDEVRNQLERSGVTQTLAQSPAAAPGTEESEEAVDARTLATKADVKGVRVDAENYKYEQSRQYERNTAKTKRDTTIGGSLTARYDYQNQAPQVPSPTDAGSGNGTVTEPRSGGFGPLAFGLNFSGNLYRDYAEGRNFTYRVALSGSNSGGSTTTSLTDAYLRYSFLPATGDLQDKLGTVTLGQQTVPFGLDAQATDPEVKAVINNAQFVTGLGLNNRQTGLLVQGDIEPYVDFANNYRAPLLSYALGIFNGNGANRGDNNDYRDVAVRLAYTLPVDYASWFRQLQIGTSYYRGAESLGTKNGDATLNSIQTKKGSNVRQGFDINWTHLPYSIAYEYASGKQDLLAVSNTNPDGIKHSKGQYINFGYTFGQQFLKSETGIGRYDDFWPTSYQLFVRFDQWDPDTSSKSIKDQKNASTLGLNVFFAETSKFQINYIKTRNQLGGDAPTVAKPASNNTIQALFNSTF